MDVRAVVCAAGFGTRFFPVTKVISKAMLPILNRPVLDYVLDDCVNGGATEIAIVCSAGDVQIRAYLSEDTALRDYFYARGWSSKYEPLEQVARGAQVRLLSQPLDGRYGTAIPAMIAEEFVGASLLYLVSGDDFVLRPHKGSLLRDMLDMKLRARADGVVAATRVRRDLTPRYGILRTSQCGVTWLHEVVEKPTVEDAPSDLASIGRFLLEPGFFAYLKDLDADPATNEYRSVDALSAYAREHRVAVYMVESGYHDCGNVDGWLQANLSVRALKRPEG